MDAEVVEPRLEQAAEGVERHLEPAAERRAGSAGSRSLRRDRPARFSTRLTVAGDTPARVAALVGVCPSNIILTIRSRPSGVSLAFLCMFI